MIPHWLPSPLTFSGAQILVDYEKLYLVFRNDFIDNEPIIVEGDYVILNNNIDKSSGGLYTYGFTHLVTIGEDSRSIDYDRACKLNWVRPILENYKQPEVLAFWSLHPKGKTLYLWLKDYDFVVILRKMESARERQSDNQKIIITAYCVRPSERRKFQKRYDNAIEIIP
ncbi:hypothetical protein CVV43_05165 [Candidatus Saccharibacteria bacterium HGW-Saccharibacteria-1]|jgi:hypothetical protein|nr:MAG: hypothetical protein CVV43_05165 [Candidatus Saccharibacteria bacterium HGW-Saccharibacteria-1]